MTIGQRDRSESRWLALLALPVLCCVGHAVLLALGVGSLAAMTGAVTGRDSIATPASPAARSRPGKRVGRPG